MAGLDKTLMGFKILLKKRTSLQVLGWDLEALDPIREVRILDLIPAPILQLLYQNGAPASSSNWCSSPSPQSLERILGLGKVRLVTDVETNKPRGYAFIEYMHTRDMKTAYKQADGRKLDNRRVLVDVERGRTVPNWRPRRLGGGLGSTRIGGEDLNQRNSGREIQSSAGHRRSEEPRARDDRHDDRDGEKSRERGRDRDLDREREKSRDRDPREDRHRHRDRERTVDPDRERDRNRESNRRDRDREISRRSGRDKERERDRDRERDRPRKRDRERDHCERTHEDADDAQPAVKREDRGTDYEHERYDEKRVKYEHSYDGDRVKHEPEDYGGEDAREEGEAVAEHEDYGYVKSERSLSRDREYGR